MKCESERIMAAAGRSGEQVADVVSACPCSLHVENQCGWCWGDPGLSLTV